MLYFSLYYSNKLLHFIGTVVIAQVIDGFGALYYCFRHFICMCDGGPRNFLVAEMYCICVLLVYGSFYVALMRTIVFRRCL